MERCFNLAAAAAPPLLLLGEWEEEAEAEAEADADAEEGDETAGLDAEPLGDAAVPDLEEERPLRDDEDEDEDDAEVGASGRVLTCKLPKTGFRGGGSAARGLWLSAVMGKYECIASREPRSPKSSDSSKSSSKSKSSYWPTLPREGVLGGSSPSIVKNVGRALASLTACCSKQTNTIRKECTLRGWLREERSPD